MEFIEDDALPMYIEEDEEEAAAAKQKRRQQSWKPPPPPPTKEEEAKEARDLAMMNKLHEYDPKLGYGCYNRIWFVDFDIFDIDEETQFGPMRFTDSDITDSHELTNSLNVLLVKIMSSDVGFPVNVYGTVIVRDRLDLKCIYIFRRNRHNCQLVQSEGESLILTGPSRGLVFYFDAYFEIDLKIKKDAEISDEQFCKALIDVDVGKFKSNKVARKTVVSWLSEVDFILSYVKNAVEGTVEIRILSGPEAFSGKINACTTNDPNPILLYDSDIDDAITLGNDNRVLQLLRRVVAVSKDQMLIVHYYACSDDQNGYMSHCICEFTPRFKGADKTEITCGVYMLQVKVTWSPVLVH
ncbi:hypothetical protein PR202_ga08727 [Eleusine coracana subsp. coracana]|uniref:DUF6598 domain-containing protein n=1 Tax=Eleusine coracana subsp. coracana TaxID=191504 RepID=A0AAV5C414_ELECO|nr:hypothetical protein QOZ80_1BG0093370 [Eleusine coracana subsp. coracana]GJM92274.1 hypothetical protein PR202_ga08727 [Eleusine coracana subsp. coracana]